MPLFEIIKKDKDDGNIIWKYPKKDFNTSSQLIVHESQEALFFANGKALDLFGAGKYTLDTNNIPLLRHLINIPTGGKSAFHCEVYFIDKSIKKSKWGTSSKLEFLEPKYNFPVSIGACGEFTFKVMDSRKLLIKLVGIKNNFNEANIDDFFDSFILVKAKSYLANIIKTKNICIFEIDNKLNEISEEMTLLLQEDFNEFGISLEKFFVTTILKPENERQYLEFKELYFQSSIGLAKAQLKQNIDIIDEDTKAKRIVIESKAMSEKRHNEGYTYQDEKGYEVAKELAHNNAVGQFTNVGLGMGLISGMSGNVSGMVASKIDDAFNPNKCNKCGAVKKDNAIYCDKCGTKFTQDKICPSCGSVNDITALFCNQCGKRLD